MPIETVFAFHEDPANLARLLRNWRGFRILHHDGNIRPGSETWVEQTVGSCVPVVMGVRYTIYEPPTRFAEQMIHGPFHQFEHIHEFESTPQGIVVRDLLDVAWPSHYGGKFVMRLCVAPMLRRVFEFRQIVLEQLLDEETSKQCSQRFA